MRSQQEGMADREMQGTNGRGMVGQGWRGLGIRLYKDTCNVEETAVIGVKWVNGVGNE